MGGSSNEEKKPSIFACYSNICLFLRLKANLKLTKKQTKSKSKTKQKN